MLKDKTMTYISLFSSAGVGCYGFHMEGFECVATNELLSRRMDVQRVNKKCKLNSGYIPGDITQSAIKQKIYDEIDKWERWAMMALMWLLQPLRARALVSSIIKRMIGRSTEIAW